MNLQFEFHRKLFTIIISSIPPKSFKDLFDTHSRDGAQLLVSSPTELTESIIGINYNYNGLLQYFMWSRSNHKSPLWSSIHNHVFQFKQMLF